MVPGEVVYESDVMNVVLPVLLFLALFVVPGYLAVSVAGGRSGPRTDPLVSLFIALLASVLLTTGLTHALAAVGLFSITALLALVGLVSLPLIVAVVCRRLRILPAWPDATGWLLFALLAGLAFVYFPPAEYVFGDADEGIYANAAIQVNECGSLWFEDALLASLPPDQRICHIPYYVKGFYFGDVRERNPVVPHGFHFFTAYLAALATVGGVSLALAGPGLLALLSVWASYLLASRLAGRWAGLAVAFLLGVNPLMVWFSRITFTEIMCQTLLISSGALLAVGWPELRHARRGVSLLALVVAGLALGAVHQVKIDFFPLPLVVMIFAFLPGIRGVREVRYFLAAYAAFFAVAVVFWITTHSVYFHGQMRDLAAVLFGREHRRTEASLAASYVILASYLVGLVVAGFLLRRFMTALGRWPWGRILAITAIVVSGAALVLAVLPAVVFPPRPSAPPSMLTSLPACGPAVPGLALEFRHGLQGLVLYTTLPGLVVGLVGIFLLFRRRDARPVFPLLILALGQLAFILVANITMDRGANYHFHGFRRHLSVTLPVLLLASVVPWFWPVPRPWRRLTRLVGVGLVLLIGIHSVCLAWPHMLRRPWQNIRATVERLARAAPPDAVWFVAADDRLARRWQVPLRFLANQQTFLVGRHVTRYAKEFFALLENLARQGKPPILLVGRSRATWVAAIEAAMGREGARAVDVEEVTVKETRCHVPDAEDFVSWKYTLYVYRKE